MTEKPISEQIIDAFIDKVSKSELLERERLEALKEILRSEKIKTADIVKVLKGSNKDENP